LLISGDANDFIGSEKKLQNSSKSTYEHIQRAHNLNLNPSDSTNSLVQANKFHPLVEYHQPTGTNTSRKISCSESFKRKISETKPTTKSLYTTQPHIKKSMTAKNLTQQYHNVSLETRDKSPCVTTQTALQNPEPTPAGERPKTNEYTLPKAFAARDSNLRGSSHYASSTNDPQEDSTTYLGNTIYSGIKRNQPYQIIKYNKED
jgi:hypothetical protein